MNIINRFVKDSIDIWDRCVSSKFLVQMQEGTLEKEAFLRYLIQDSLYLRDYLKTYSYGFIKCKSWRHMKFFASSINYINSTENSTRINYLKEFNLTDKDIDEMSKSEACEKYTEFLLYIGKNEDVPSILASVLPCMISYNYVFDKVSKQSPAILSGFYFPLINDYINCEYCKTIKLWSDFANQIFQKLSDNKLSKLKDIFYQASIYELLFWEEL